MSEPTDPGIWADPEPKHKKPEEPIVVNVINDGSPSEFEDINRAFDKLAKSFNKAGQAMAGFAGIHPGQQIGRITRNQDMMSADVAAVKNLYYQEPQPQGPINTTPAGSHIPRVVVEVEGRKPHIQQFVDITRKTNGKA